MHPPSTPVPSFVILQLQAVAAEPGLSVLMIPTATASLLKADQQWQIPLFRCMRTGPLHACGLCTSPSRQSSTYSGDVAVFSWARKVQTAEITNLQIMCPDDACMCVVL